MQEVQKNNLLNNIVALVKHSQQQVLRAVNSTMVYTYFEIGRMIVEEEQNGYERAAYGKEILKILSEHLTNEFGKGFSVRNLEFIRKFYLTYSNSKSLISFSSDKTIETSIGNIISKSVISNFEKEKTQTLTAESQNSETTSRNFKLSWTHYVFLLKVDNELERNFYEIESFKNNWSVRELKRQYNSALFTRLSLSKNKDEVLQLATKGQIIEKASDLIKDPYVLEFLGLPELPSYSENELEEQLISKLEDFLLELGHGFTFVSRQKRISFDDKHFYIDLVFYNRLLKCFVLIDLKIGELKHQDVGQMQMYVNYYDREVKLDDENKTIGLILCQNKSDFVVKYTLPEDNEQIFASKYQMILPTKEELEKIL